MEENLQSENESRSKRTRFSDSTPELIEDAVRKIVEERRKWSFTDLGEKHLKNKRKGLDFTVMTYNILSQQNLELNAYLYSHCEDDVLNWEYRVGKLLAEVRSQNCDVICLQEIEQSHYEDDFNPELKTLGYCGLFKKKTGDQNDGCAIFFKTQIFNLDQEVPVEFKSSEARVLDRDNIGLIAVLKPKHKELTESKVIVATTHLLYNPRRGDVKLSQLRVLLAEVDRLAFKGYSETCRPKYYPVILCGDMNSEPFSPLYNFVTCGSIFYKDMKSGTVSGQPEGRNKGRQMNSDELSLSPLGINRDSKYENIEIIRQRKMIFGKSEEEAEASENNPSLVSKICSQKSGKADGTETGAVSVSEPSCDKIESSSSELAKDDDGTGAKSKLKYFSHHLNFMSVYKHYKLDGSKETTIHNRGSCCTVDYIFHSVDNKYSFIINGRAKHKNITEGSLRHLGNYGLLTEGDLKDIGGLPNAYLSSDHLCLITRFLLTS